MIGIKREHYQWHATGKAWPDEEDRDAPEGWGRELRFTGEIEVEMGTPMRIVQNACENDAIRAGGWRCDPDTIEVHTIEKVYEG